MLHTHLTSHPSDFWLFPTTKDTLRGRTFSSRSALATAIFQLSPHTPKEAFAAAMQSWHQRCEKCVRLQGDYFEKWLHLQFPRVSNFFLLILWDLRTWTHHVGQYFWSSGLLVFWVYLFSEARTACCKCGLMQLTQRTKYLNKFQQDAANSSLFFFVFCSTCFGRYIHPSGCPALTRVQATSPTHTFHPAVLNLAHTSPSHKNDLYSYTTPDCRVEAPYDGRM
jgi:hypothetical protein